MRGILFANPSLETLPPRVLPNATPASAMVVHVTHDVSQDVRHMMEQPHVEGEYAVTLARNGLASIQLNLAAPAAIRSFDERGGLLEEKVLGPGQEIVLLRTAARPRVEVFTADGDAHPLEIREGARGMLQARHAEEVSGGEDGPEIARMLAEQEELRRKAAEGGERAETREAPEAKVEKFEEPERERKPPFDTALERGVTEEKVEAPEQEEMLPSLRHFELEPAPIASRPRETNSPRDAAFIELKRDADAAHAHAFEEFARYGATRGIDPSAWTVPKKTPPVSDEYFIAAGRDNASRAYVPAGDAAPLGAVGLVAAAGLNQGRRPEPETGPRPRTTVAAPSAMKTIEKPGAHAWYSPRRWWDKLRGR